MKYLIVFPLLLSVLACNKPKKANQIKIRPFINKIVDSIAKYNSLHGPDVGYAGGKSRQRLRFENLSKNASIGELDFLTNYNNGVVRCYAFLALVLKNDSCVFQILLNHLRDNESISTMNYDVGGWNDVGDYFLQIVSPSYTNIIGYKLNYTQKTEVDSILLYGKGIKLSAKYQLLINLKGNLKYYNRIKEIATEEKSPVACVALARFQKQTDVPVIIQLFSKESTEYYGIYSVREFPDTIFYPKLVTVFENEWRQEGYDYQKWCILYQALSKYPTPQTLKLFEKTLNTKDDFRRNTLGVDLMIALTKYPNPYFDPIKRKIHLDDDYKDDVKSQIDIEK